jgi:hypothetical protein
MDESIVAQLRPVDGRKFPESLLSILGLLLLNVFVLGPLGCGLVLAWWYGWSFADRQISWYGAIIGLALFGCFLLTPLLILKMFRRETLIVGKECFQVVVGADKVTQQIPYANIAKIRMLTNHQGADFVRDFIGIALVDTEDPATLCPAAETVMKLHGWHSRIQTGLRPVPLEQLYELIRKELPADVQPDV